MEQSPLATALEEQALEEAVSYWREFPKEFSYANPYVCGRAWTPRIADIVLLHLLSPPPPEPVSAAQAEARLQGARQKHDVHLLTHYSRDASFRSFYWGPGPTVRHIEAKENPWLLLPLTSNYGISIDGKLGPDAGAKVFSRKGADWFSALRHDSRGAHEAFVSLPDEIVVMMAAMPRTACANARKLDSMVGLEKPHNTFTVYYQDGHATFRYGQEAWDRPDKVNGLQLRSQWVNLADSIGFVVVNFSQDPSCILLPRPGVRDSLSLRHVENPACDQCFVTVALPNQDHHRTEAMRAKITGSYAGGVMTCLVPPYFMWANFSDQAARVELPQGMESAGPVRSQPSSVGILHWSDQTKIWSPLE
jgi:hypothetical protein